MATTAASPIPAIQPLRPVGSVTNLSDAKEASTAKTASKAENQGSVANLRQRSNAGILQASMSLAIQSGDQSQALVFKTVIGKLDEILKADGSGTTIQQASTQDQSPEATAGRIVSLVAGFYDAFAKQNTNLSPSEVADKFQSVIGGGIQKGVQEAQDILKGLGVLQGDIASNIVKTQDLALKGLADFVTIKKNVATQAT